MDSQDNLLELLLDQAIQFRDKTEREEWLLHIFDGQPEKQKELRELIEHHESGMWLDHPPKAVVTSRKLIDDLTGEKIGPFVLMKRIGSGGMGDVYLAQQHEPVFRQVALKLILWDAEPKQVVERFQREKQMLASMDHPNIARIIDAGTTESGCSYLVMEYVNGSHLVDYCTSKNPDIHARIKLIWQCCRAIQHAHQKGIIHRDIKPNNIMVAEIDGEPTIKIIDFGIAKASINETIKQNNEYTSSVVNLLTNSLTHRGNSPGTPPYMSPEQFSRHSSNIDTRSDIYSIGAVLYYVLTQQQPFEEAQLATLDFTEIGELVSKNDPPLPSQKNPKLAKALRGDLDSMVRKAMCRNVEQRYQSAAQFAEDLQNYLRGDSVSTNPDSPWTQFRKLAKRYQLLFAACALAFASIFVAWLFAESQKREAIASRAREIQSSTVANLLAASSALQRNEYTLASQTLDAIPEPTTRLDARLLRSQIPRRPSTLAKVDGKIYYGLSMDSLQAIVCGTNRSMLCAFDQATGNLLFEIDTKQLEINGLALSPDGNTIATAGDDGTVKFWDLEAKALLNQFVVSKKVFQVAWSADGQSIITASPEPNAKIWSYPQGQLLREIGSKKVDLECIASSKANLFAIGDRTGMVRVGEFDSILHTDSPSDYEDIRSRFYKYSGCSCMSFSPSGDLIAIGLDRGYLILARIRKGDLQVFEQIKFVSDVTAIAFSKDERKLAIGESRGVLHVLDLREPWPENSRVGFTPAFFEQHPEHFQGIADPEMKIRELISRTDPPEALDHLPLNCDRVTIDFKEPMRHFLFTTEFVREWFESDGDTSKTHREMPVDVIPNDKSVELRFRNRGSLWTDSNSLRLEDRLESWDNHSERISSVAWGKNQTDLFSFSEDNTISKIQTAKSRRDVLLSNAEKLYTQESDRVFLANSSDQDFRLVDVGNSDFKESRIEPLVKTKSPRIKEHFDGKNFFLYYLDYDGDSSKPHWSVDRWQLGKSRESRVAVIPGDLWLEPLICQVDESLWLGRFSSWNGDLFQRDKLSFLGLWDENKNDFCWKHEPNMDPFRHVQVSIDRRFLVYEKNGSVYRVDLKTGHEKPFLVKPNESVSGMMFSPNGQVLAIALEKKLCIQGYSMADERLLWELPLHGGPIKEFCWSRDQATLVTLSMDRCIRTYDIAMRRITTQIPLSMQEPRKLAIPPDEKAIFVLDEHGTIIRLPISLETGK